MDPIEIDTNNYHHDLAKYNRAVEAMIPIVKDDYAFFESFLMDEYPDIYDEINDLHDIHDSFIWGAAYNKCDHIEGRWMLVYRKWNDYVLSEAKRRIEG